MLLNTLSEKFEESLVSSDIVPAESADIYVYGFEVFLSSFIGSALTAVIGLILGRTVETLIILLIFIGLRSFTGGFHADRYWLCMAVSLVIYGAVLALSCFVGVSVYMFALLFSIGYCRVAFESSRAESK